MSEQPTAGAAPRAAAKANNPFRISNSEFKEAMQELNEHVDIARVEYLRVAREELRLNENNCQLYVDKKLEPMKKTLEMLKVRYEPKDILDNLVYMMAMMTISVQMLQGIDIPDPEEINKKTKEIKAQRPDLGDQDVEGIVTRIYQIETLKNMQNEIKEDYLSQFSNIDSRMKEDFMKGNISSLEFAEELNRTRKEPGTPDSARTTPGTPDSAIAASEEEVSDAGSELATALNDDSERPGASGKWQKTLQEEKDQSKDVQKGSCSIM